MACVNHWIPACAGMTVGVGGRNLSGIAKGLSGWRLTHSCPCRHSSEGWNPGGRGREVQGWQSLSDGAFGCRCCDCHSRYAGMACVNHWIPACAGMTTGAKVRNLSDMAEELSEWRQTHSDPRRHSSEGPPESMQAWIRPAPAFSRQA